MRRQWNLEDLKRQASATQRLLIRPKKAVTVVTESDRQKAIAVARKVIAEHREVLEALKDR